MHCIQIEFEKASLFSRYSIHNCIRDCSDRHAIGKLYSGGVRWFGRYTADPDDLIGPSLMLVSKSRSDLLRLLGMKR
jgi:hypothetical protein